MVHLVAITAESLTITLPLALTLILCKGASLRSIIFCEGTNTNFIQRRSERANPSSEGANPRSINSLRDNHIPKGANHRTLILYEGGLREITLSLRECKGASFNMVWMSCRIFQKVWCKTFHRMI